MLLRGADDGRGAAHGQRADLAGADSLHDQSRRGRCHPRQRRIPAAAGSDPREDPARREVRADQRRRLDAADARSHSQPSTSRCSRARRRRSRSRHLDENTRATTFYTTGTTGLPKGVYYSHRQLVLHTLATMAALANAPHATFTARDVYMPITPMFHVHAWGLPYVATHARRQAGLPRPLCAGRAARPDRPREGDVLALRADDPADDARQPGRCASVDLRSMEGDHRRLGAAAAARPRRRRARHRRDRRLRDVGNLSDPDARASDAADARCADARRACRTDAGPGGRSRSSQLRIVDAAHERRRARRREPGRGRRARAVADAGLSRRAREVGGPVARRLAAHRRRRRDRRGWLSQDRRPHQGRREDRRRMGVVAGSRGHHPARARHCRGGRRRRSRRPLGRASGRAGRRASRRRRAARPKTRFVATSTITRSAARSRSTRCPTACTSSTPSRRPASASSTRK